MNAPRDKLGYIQKVKPSTAFNCELQEKPQQEQAKTEPPEDELSVTKYEIELKPAAVRTLNKLPPQLQKRIATKINSLHENPRPVGVEKLSEHTNIYRIRVGDYRIFYEIHDDLCLVRVALIEDRKEGYRRLKRKLS
jgi:mRNA interferase RelE/StbE